IYGQRLSIFVYPIIYFTLFFNYNAGKARKVRQSIKNHRDVVYRIDVCIVEDPTEREIYETYIINEYKAKYNVDKVFYK
ncbi:hypothetical protein, partial [Bacillus toyonensis]|uniref:hypothetical protein n=1 Tax=Bacillus toyonensis TaxID=155322 RepID=UPI002E23F59F|nr:hypothetical protein [Bacillus toyonensis]